MEGGGRVITVVSKVTCCTEYESSHIIGQSLQDFEIFKVKWPKMFFSAISVN